MSLDPKPLPIVDVSKTLAPCPAPFIIRYSILRDKTATEIEVYAREHPGVYVFPFATEAGLDYSSLAPPGPEWKTYVVQPMYVGNLDLIESAIQQCVDAYIAFDGITPELVDDI